MWLLTLLEDLYSPKLWTGISQFDCHRNYCRIVSVLVEVYSPLDLPVVRFPLSIYSICTEPKYPFRVRETFLGLAESLYICRHMAGCSSEERYGESHGNVAGSL